MNRVAHFELPYVWPKVVAWLEAAVQVNQGDENLLDVGMALEHGTYELWHQPDRFAAVVQIQDFPRQRVVVVLYAGGVLGAFQEMYAEAKRLAKQRGANVFRTFGRPGWERALGLKKVGVILQEDL